MKIFIYGIGNPGRQDDGLGSLFVEAVQDAVNASATGSNESMSGLSGHEFSFDSNYQLNIEDAEAISRHDTVVFVDASLGGGAQSSVTPGPANPNGNSRMPFRFYHLEPEPTASFSTHSVSAGGIVALCSALYETSPKAYMLAIRGYEWGVNEPLSAQAAANLRAATEFLLNALATPVTDADPGGHSLLDRFVS